METLHSDEANAVSLEKSWDHVCEEAEAFEDDETQNELAVGFDLAMKLVQMSSLSKYIGADLKVWAVTGQGYNATAYFVAASEEELLARLAPLPE